jgi:SAM-dependent methyltransferase
LPGFFGLDIAPLPGVDVVCDLERIPWPFKDSSGDEVVLFNILEHLPNTIKTMEEIWRICKPGALVRILVPYYNSPGAFQDPTHVRFFSERTFDYFTDDSATELSEYNYYSFARFEINSIDFQQRQLLCFFPRRAQVFLAHHLATVHGLDVRLRTRKLSVVERPAAAGSATG